MPMPMPHAPVQHDATELWRCSPDDQLTLVLPRAVVPHAQSRQLCSTVGARL